MDKINGLAYIDYNNIVKEFKQFMSPEAAENLAKAIFHDVDEQCDQQYFIERLKRISAMAIAAKIAIS